jgi:hypothetical protein
MRGAAATAAAVACLASGLPSAEAGDLGTFTSSNVRIRSTPYTTSGTVYGLGQKGQRACVLGSTHGQTITDLGHSTNTWLYVKDLTTGIGPGWVWEWYTSASLKYGGC